MVETEFRPDWFSKPGDTLSALMNTHKISPRGLAECLGYDPGFVQGLLSGVNPIDDRVAALLSKNIGGSPKFWVARQAQFDSCLDKAAQALPMDQIKSWTKILPLKEMSDAGWIAKSREFSSMVKSSLSYFGVSGPIEWQERYAEFENSFSFRTSPTFESKVGALSAWLRQGEIQAGAISCADWNADRFREQLNDIRVLTKAKNPNYFIPKLRTMCAEVGVAVVFVRAPSGCRASGATRFLSSSKAMIILSFRHLSDDHFWFTFFHEAGHLLLHGDRSTFIDGAMTDHTEKESEANTFSAGVLVPHARLDALMNLRPRMPDVIRFGLSIGVSPGIVVGQMQHLELIGPGQLNHLKRRYNWEQIQQAL